MVDRSDGPDAGERDAAEQRLLAAVDAALESAQDLVARGDSVAGGDPVAGGNPVARGDRVLSGGGASVGGGEFADLRTRCSAALTVAPAAEEARARRVERAILARTTREDLSRRRDLGLVLSFFGDRLRESALLRVAAAAFLVNITLVPLVAYHLVGEAERPQLTIRLGDGALEELEEELPSRDPASRLIDEDDGPEVDLSPLPVGSLEAASALTADGRAWLAALELPPATTELGHLLEAACADVAAGGAARSSALAQLVERLDLDRPAPARTDGDDAWIDWIRGGLEAVEGPGPLVSAWLAAARKR